MAKPPDVHADDDVSVAVVLGRCDDMRAEVFIRGLVPTARGPLALVGTVSGPRCRRAITLPVAARLQDIPAPSGTLSAAEAGQHGPAPAVARVILTEPSFWTADLPNLYRLEASLRCDDRDIGRIDRLIGLRRLGVRGRSFWLDGRRWVPRCVACEPTASAVTTAADVSASAYLTDPDEQLLEIADERGTAVIALLPAGATLDHAVARMQRWSLHPAVMGVIMPLEATAADVAALAAESRGLRSTLLLGASVRGDHAPIAPPAGIDFLAVMMPAGHLPDAAWRAPPPVPVLAVRSAGERTPDIAARRSACDRLQADLAAWGLAGVDGEPGPRPWDWAGYAVT